MCETNQWHQKHLRHSPATSHSNIISNTLIHTPPETGSQHNNRTPPAPPLATLPTTSAMSAATNTPQRHPQPHLPQHLPATSAIRYHQRHRRKHPWLHFPTTSAIKHCYQHPIQHLQPHPRWHPPPTLATTREVSLSPTPWLEVRTPIARRGVRLKRKAWI